MTTLDGFHHLTAITADARGNRRFYTDTLGMRLVKKTVNQDDTTAYHLFYADGLASPGTDITFFDWPAAPERRGTGSVIRTGLRVAGAEALEYWHRRLREAGTPVAEIGEFGGRAGFDFEDPEGQRLRLIEDGGAGEAHPWAGAAVPEPSQIRGLGAITLSTPVPERTGAMLTDLLGMTEAESYRSGERDVRIFRVGEGGPERELHLVAEPNGPVASQGRGGVHHVAFRAADATVLRDWQKRLREARVPSSGEIDRHYFRSLYFREPGGVLFEIATDGPGFAVDEPLESLGEALSLPPFLEPRRAEIEARLKPLD